MNDRYFINKHIFQNAGPKIGICGDELLHTRRDEGKDSVEEPGLCVRTIKYWGNVLLIHIAITPVMLNLDLFYWGTMLLIHIAITPAV